MVTQPVIELLPRLSPAVQEIIRLDLIQAVGNALRLRQREKNETAELEEFLAEQEKLGEQWGSF
ncbi:hypothetical protein [Duganella sp. FT27W]|uniref:hypothetical protein n=1 Tax=Duganella sp. FT27W TaxID=2654636 RepID=UPI00128B3879|nr:hypothetical protein [Duganella sp. FT27W]MPQ56329.1 hypothetical protein [Duganella sp. FT27W]